MIKIPFGAANDSDVSSTYYLNSNPKFPLITIGAGTYMVNGWIRTSIEQDFGANRTLIHNIHVGRYTSIAVDTSITGEK